ncbi:hypothetical protein BASA61_004125 [Batrachochytrium salamandrivorans]|nr:hypothetical protein BASA61_004125 [Batrachochytrium salamandrivorans]
MGSVLSWWRSTEDALEHQDNGNVSWHKHVHATINTVAQNTAYAPLYETMSPHPTGPHSKRQAADHSLPTCTTMVDYATMLEMPFL